MKRMLSCAPIFPVAIAFAALLMVGVGCSEAQFASGSNSKKAGSGTNPSPGPTDPTNPVNPNCTNRTKVTGAHLLFLMDNSGSMQQTDCPARYGQYCQGETNREKAVLLAYDSLSQLRSQYINQPSSISSISYAQFTPDEIGGGKPQQIAVEANGVGRASLQNQLMFNRRPSGDTPYQEAVTAAKTLYDNIQLKYANDGKPRVVVLVTDGEPTDRDPYQVYQNIKNFRAGGVKWITVMVTNGIVKGTRTQAHRDKLLSYYERQLGPRQPNGHWYAPHYSSFESYFQDIMNLPGSSSDQVIEIDTSDKLQQVILEEIVHKTVTCEG